MPISLVVADHNHLVLRGLTGLFTSEGFEVLAACTDGADALEAVRSHRPDVAVLEIHTPGLSGLEVARRMLEEQVSSRIVLLAATLEEEETLEALRLGVHGLVLKGNEVGLIVQCIRDVHAGAQWVDHRSALRALEFLLRVDERARKLALILTRREMEIMLLAARGLGNRQIAANLCVSEGTIKTHLHNIYEKLNVTGRLGLMHYAQGIGLDVTP